MSIPHITSNGSCECQQSKFVVDAKPLMRAICHCTICQEFNDAPFGDIVIVKRSGIDLDSNHKVEFKSYASPPIVKRGKCTECGKPAIEFFRIPPFPDCAIIPTANLADSSNVPDAQMHVFYNRRVNDADDQLPKYNGYLPSQTAFFMQLIRGSFA